MKKTINFLIIILFSVFTLSATSSWSGIQGLMFSADQTMTISYGDFSGSPVSVESKGIGCVLSGTHFSSEESSLGLGYQLGATLTKEITTEGEASSVDFDDQNLAWMGGLSGQYRLGSSSSLDMEIGLGLLFEHSEQSDSDSENAVTVTSSTLSSLISATLFANLTDNFFLIGGIDCLFPLSSSAKLTQGIVTMEYDVDSEGYSIVVRLGFASNI